MDPGDHRSAVGYCKLASQALNIGHGGLYLWDEDGMAILGRFEVVSMRVICVNHIAFTVLVFVKIVDVLYRIGRLDVFSFLHG